MRSSKRSQLRERGEKQITLNTFSSADSKDFIGYATTRNYFFDEKCNPLVIFLSDVFNEEDHGYHT
jgi:hypothetical protein